MSNRVAKRIANRVYLNLCKIIQKEWFNLKLKSYLIKGPSTGNNKITVSNKINQLVYSISLQIQQEKHEANFVSYVHSY